MNNDTTNAMRSDVDVLQSGDLEIGNDGRSHKTKNVDDKANGLVGGYNASYEKTNTYYLMIVRSCYDDHGHTYLIPWA